MMHVAPAARPGKVSGCFSRAPHRGAGWQNGGSCGDSVSSLLLPFASPDQRLAFCAPGAAAAEFFVTTGLAMLCAAFSRAATMPALAR